MTAEQRPCLHCGTAFTWTPASPRKRFCSQPCRLAWWGARRRQATAALRRGDIRLPALPAARRDRRLARATGRGQHRHAATTRHRDQ